MWFLMDYIKAKEIANDYLKSKRINPDFEFILQEGKPVFRGWIFIYDRKRKDNQPFDKKNKKGGPFPGILVSRFTGKISKLGLIEYMKLDKKASNNMHLFIYKILLNRNGPIVDDDDFV